MITGIMEWLVAPYLVLALVVYIAWHVARRHTYQEIDREYEKLCIETGREIF